MKKLIKWLGILVAVVVGLIALVAAIGAFLPRDHVAVRQVVIDKPAEEIWAVMADFGAAPSWRPEIEKCERMPDQNGHEVWKEIGEGQEIPYEAIEMDAPRRMVRNIVDPNLPFGGGWTMELSPSGTGTQVKITEEGFVSNPIWRFVSVVVIGHTTYLDLYLTNLGKKFGQDVKPASPTS